MKQVISIAAIPNIVAAPLSVGIRHGQLVSVCGMAPLSPEGTLVGIGDVEAQTHQVLHNMALVLAEAGATMDDVIKTTVLLANIDDYDRMNVAYARHFPEGRYPTRSAIGVKLGHPDLLVEIEALAVIPEKRS